jgi:hypothetical protein
MSKSVEVNHCGWIEREKRRREDSRDGSALEAAEESQAALTNEEVEKIVREWRARNLRLGFEEKEGYRDLTVRVLILRWMCDQMLINVRTDYLCH